jgi:hypothetical protein
LMNIHLVQQCQSRRWQIYCSYCHVVHPYRGHMTFHVDLKKTVRYWKKKTLHLQLEFGTLKNASYSNLLVAKCKNMMFRTMKIWHCS